MSIVSLFPLTSKRRNAIDVVVLDATIQETHNFTASVTRQPVEQGALIQDNIVLDPERLTLQAEVSNNPISPDLRQRVVSSFSFLRPAQRSFEVLKDLYSQRQLVTVFTSLHIYRNMAIENITIPRTASTSNVLNFTISLVKVRKAGQTFTPFGQILNLADSAINDARIPINRGRRLLQSASGRVSQTVTNALRGVF